jgi:hypothetical protein
VSVLHRDNSMTTVEFLTPDTLFVTNKRIIISNPTMLGARQTIDVINFNQITSVQLGKGVFSSTIKLRTYGY